MTLKLSMLIEDAPNVNLPDERLTHALSKRNVSVSTCPYYRHRDFVLPEALKGAELIGIMGTLAAIRNWSQLNTTHHAPFFLPLFSSQFHRVHRYHGHLPEGSRLNENAAMLPYGQVKSKTAFQLSKRIGSDPMMGMVIKPDQALKVAEAALVGPDSQHRPIREIFERTGLSDDSLMWFGPQTPLVREYRCLILEGQCISASTYGFLQESVNADHHRSLINQASLWAQSLTFDDPAYMMDIGERRDGSLAIIELNALSTSGLYEVNRNAIADAWVTSASHIWERDYAF